MLRLLRWVLFALGGLAVLVTLLPFVPSNEAAIRVWDFPRLQVAALLAAVLLATPFVSPLRRRRTWAFASVAASGVYGQMA